MKRCMRMIVFSVCFLLLSACSGNTPAEGLNQWNCTVPCAAESSADAYIITYGDEEIVSQSGMLSFQNRNNFDIVIHLLAAGKDERTAEIPAGGVSVLYQVEKELAYTVGCHAEVGENTEIKLMVYDGNRSETYS